MASPEEQHIGWIPWTPKTAENWVYEDVAQAIKDFDPVDKPAGHAATAWLRNQALGAHPSTTTWLHYAEGQLEGFFSICVSSFMLHDTVTDKLPGRGRRPASEVTWICRGAKSEVRRARPLDAGCCCWEKDLGDEKDAVLVINPFDEATAALEEPVCAVGRTRL